MPLLNNFSVLPWYEHIEDQDFRKWWKYGSVYALYSLKSLPIPSQIMREGKKTGYNPDELIPYDEDNTQSACRLTASGGQVSDPSYDGESWVDCYNFSDFPVGTDIIILTLAETYGDGVAWSICDEDDSPLTTGMNAGSIDLVQILEDYPTADRIYIERTTEDLVNRLYVGTGDPSAVAIPLTTTLHKLDGTLVADVYKPGLWAGKHIETAPLGISPNNVDYLIFGAGGVTFDNPVPIGQYYLKASDGSTEWVSDVITFVNSADDYLCIEWKDDDDFYMDSGVIVYTSPTFKNRLYLQADIAKPEYEFEEEGDTRDGVFYPTKQISKKKYKFNFLATEYLLDVMRFIRMADYINISWQKPNETVHLYPSTFLMTPDWEKEGDLAGVAVEFETDTVAKKIGLAYIRETS